MHLLALLGFFGTARCCAGSSRVPINGLQESLQPKNELFELQLYFFVRPNPKALDLRNLKP